MAHLTGEARSRYVREMFARIAPRYDLMNRLMTAGQDVRWRREVIVRAALPAQACLLDLGAGTGDLALEAKRQHPDCRAVAVDFTLAMMRMGQRRARGLHLRWTAADTLILPFPEGTFDAVISGFLLRNVSDVQRALEEQHRVLKPGGKVVVLDTTRQPENIFAPLIRLHTRVVIPFLGGLLTGHRDAYTYLPESTANFLRAEELAARMAVAGFRRIGYRHRMFGAVAVHWGEK